MDILLQRVIPGSKKILFFLFFYHLHHISLPHKSIWLMSPATPPPCAGESKNTALCLESALKKDILAGERLKTMETMSEVNQLDAFIRNIRWVQEKDIKVSPKNVLISRECSREKSVNILEQKQEDSRASWPTAHVHVRSDRHGL